MLTESLRVDIYSFRNKLRQQEEKLWVSAAPLGAGTATESTRVVVGAPSPFLNALVVAMEDKSAMLLRIWNLTGQATNFTLEDDRCLSSRVI